MIRDAIIAEIELVRAEIESVLAKISSDRQQVPGANGDWSVKDTIAHITEWARWNFAQIRSALEDADPVLDGTRPPYPPEFDDLLETDERNRLIYEASQSRGLDEVKHDFDAVVDGFIAWLRTRSDTDLNLILGLDVNAVGEIGPSTRLIKRADQASGLINLMPLSQMLFDSDADVGSITHWHLHLSDLRDFAERATKE